MGYFKSISIQRKRKRKIIALAFFIILFALFLKYVVKININEIYRSYFPKYYFGANLSFKEESISAPVFKEDNNPVIYIYNTHQTESYKYNKITPYNIDYSVMFASYILKSYLDEYNISSIVETDSISQVLNNNNLKYKDSYKASRILLEQSVIKYPTLKYFVDVHRDSSIYEKTTCTFNDKTYAKIMFVVGLEHDNYKVNLNVATKLNELIKEVEPCLSRGILQKGGQGVDGKYNQDFDGNTILVEIGGQYNEISEVNNTLKVLASILYEYIMEDE